MAIFKEVEDKAGYTASYHRIRNLYIGKDGKVSFQLLSYKDASKREAEEQANSIMGAYVMHAEFYEYQAEGDVPTASYAGVYAWLKTTDKFKDAEDC